MKKIILISTLLYSQLLIAQVYVDQSAVGNNDGSSWSDAFTSIQTAVNSASENDTILIAQGTYKEGTEITINHPVTIKGGYPPGGGIQDIVNNQTFIDGSNRHRVLKAEHASGTLFLEGLTIQNGKVVLFDTAISAEGGGIHSTGNLNLKFINVQNNFISSIDNSFGGGIYTNSGSITLTNSLVINNTALSLPGTGNMSFGGGVYTLTGNLTLTNSQISNNTVASFSFIFDDSETFSYGGGIYTDDGSVLLINSKVSYNTAFSFSFIEFSSSHGGGIYGINNSAGLTLINSMVIGNRVISSGDQPDSIGGGIAGDFMMQNSILWGNTQSANGGVSFSASEFNFGILTANHSVVKGQNLTGQGVGNVDASVANFASDNFIDAANGNLGLTTTSVLRNTGNNTYLPVDTYDVDDDGNTTEVIPITLSGADRINDTTVDIGVYESDFSGKNYSSNATAYYFDINNTTSTQDGLSWATAFSRLNDYFHIQDKSNITDLYLTDGVYRTTGVLEFSAITTISGGYNASTGNLNPTKTSGIDAQLNARVINANQHITLNNIHVFNGLLNVTNGNVGGGGINAQGDITLNNSQVSNNTAYSNFDVSFGARGGGIYAIGAVIVTNSLISNNQTSSSSNLLPADTLGGGMYASGTVTLTNSQINNNQASAYSISFSNADSDSDASGGGIYASGAMTLTNSLINNNQALSSSFSREGAYSETFGGGVYTSGGINIINSQISNNQVSSHSNTVLDSDSLINTFGGGIYGVTTFDNSILWGNRELRIDQVNIEIDGFNEHDNGTLTTSHSLVKGRDLSAENGIDDGDGLFDPLFVNEAAGNFRLLADSPLIDAGDFNLLPMDEYDIDGDGDFMELLPLDLDGYARDLGLNVDIGPYEYGDLIFKDGFE